VTGEGSCRLSQTGGFGPHSGAKLLLTRTAGATETNESSGHPGTDFDVRTEPADVAHDTERPGPSGGKAAAHGAAEGCPAREAVGASEGGKHAELVAGAAVAHSRSRMSN
jgi:hypothetical protein